MSATAGCTTYLPPVAAPAPIPLTPSADIGPPPDGMGTVVIDADRPAQVKIGQTICLTPCTAHLPRGNHPLQFRSPDGRDWHGEAAVNVGTRPVGFRYAVGHHNRHVGARTTGWVLFGVGLGLVGTGSSFMLANDGTYADTAYDNAGGMALLGVAMAVIGSCVLATVRREFQPGMGVQWELPEPPSPAEPAMPAASH